VLGNIESSWGLFLEELMTDQSYSYSKPWVADQYGGVILVHAVKGDGEVLFSDSL
jgi:hypothetical protein